MRGETHTITGKRGIFILAMTTIALASTVSAGWTATYLNPAGATSSYAYGIRLGKVAGGVDSTAALWSGTAASRVNLGTVVAYATDGVEQVGQSFDSNPYGAAAIWSGTAGTRVDLLSPPSGLDPTYDVSAATGVFNGLQSGWKGSVLGGPLLAGMWTDAPNSWISLNPAGKVSSFATGIYNAQEVGWASVVNNGPKHAGLWNSDAATWVDLNPAGAGQSVANGVFNPGNIVARQVGGADLDAGFWTSTPGSWVNLGPAGASSSEGLGINGTGEVGDATFGGVIRAGLWTDTAASWVDLQNYLTPNYISSRATGIYTANTGITSISGYAYNTDTGNYEAVLWTQTVPEPGSAGVFIAAATLILRRRSRRA